MTDRLEQARAEAERRWPLYPEDDQDDRDHTNAMRFIFMQGAEWEHERADANPQPADGSTSDGYHTFDELYEYRMLYNAHASHGWLHAWQGAEGETDATCIAAAIDANTEATLALAFEQRTIALIEYAKVADDETADLLWVDHITPRLGLGDER